MGKFVGFIGGIAGKVGNVVFSKGDDGKTYGRAYQPNVANPNTKAQRDQRAKMNLAGRLSMAVPASAIIGLGAGSGRIRRSMFNSNILKAVSIVSGDTTVASLAPENIVFSKGAQSIGAQVSTPVALTAAQMTMGLTRTSGEVGRYGEKIVVLVVDPEDEGGYSEAKVKDVVFDSDQPVSVSVPFGVPLKDGVMVCVYRLPYALTDDAMRLRTQTLANDGQDIIAKLLVTDGSVQDWGLSVLEASQVFTQA